MQVTQFPAHTHIHTLHHENRKGIQKRRRAQPQKITRSVSDSPSVFFDFGAFGGYEAPHRAPTVITENHKPALPAQAPVAECMRTREQGTSHRALLHQRLCGKVAKLRLAWRVVGGI